jgi:MerR family transcriptional regulator, thiopeptide resistance regulator
VDGVDDGGQRTGGYSVGEVAGFAHVSVRTLHHYDAIGLLRPSARSAAGHRRYDDADLRRLQEILLYRELGFGLDTIAAMLADPGPSVDAHLRTQHRLLRQRIGRDQELLVAIEKEMEARAMGSSLSPQEQFEVFGTDRIDEWSAEAEDRFGDDPTYQESRRRTAGYTKEDWQELKAESDAGLRRFRDALAGGVPATGPAARALAEDHRAFLSRWFYDCDHPRHRALAEMYVQDERFTATFEAVAPGLAGYVHDAIVANADAHSAG